MRWPNKFTGAWEAGGHGGHGGERSKGREESGKNWQEVTWAAQDRKGWKSFVETRAVQMKDSNYSNIWLQIYRTFGYLANRGVVRAQLKKFKIPIQIYLTENSLMALFKKKNLL